MNPKKRRYLFAAWSDVEKLDFEYLEKVCDRFFICIPEQVRWIPLSIVQRLQRIGRGVKWLVVRDASADTLHMQLAFLMGKLHQKLPEDIEFAILSDDPVFDPLVNFIFENNRRCCRVLVSKMKEGKPPADTLVEETPKERLVPERPTHVAPSKLNAVSYEQTVAAATSSGTADEQQIRKIAAEVVERLVRSGNRPHELSTLKQYISLSNSSEVPGLVEKVIIQMTMNNEIEVQDKIVHYHF